MSKLTRAGPAEILRASQKDEYICNKLKDIIFEILIHVKGTRVLINYRDLLAASASFLYYGTTTLSGLQTLGEEYTGILQLDSEKSNIPEFKKRLLMVLLSGFGQNLVHLLLMYVQKNKYLKNDNCCLRPEAKQHIIKIISYLKILTPFLERLHKAVFYWTGYYEQLSKRVTGIQYILIRYWLKNRETLYGFKLLSIVTVLQTLIAGTMNSAAIWNSLNSEQYMDGSEHNSKSLLSRKKCPLCLDERKNASLTLCGHLFCWTCILEWVQNEQKCPICRQSVLPNRIVPLQHYS